MESQSNRPNKATPRAEGKSLIGYFGTTEEKEALKDAAKDRGITLAELMRRIATGAIALVDAED